MDDKTSEWRPGPTVCRCCLTEGCYKDISTEYFWMGKREVYAEMLSETFNVSIAYSQSGGPNSNSRLICEPCISRLRDASEFKRQVQECEKTFMQHLDPGTSISMEIEPIPEQTEKPVKLERVKLEKQYSDDDFGAHDFDGPEDDDDDLDDQPLTKFATKVPKKESVDLLDLLDNSQITLKRKSKAKAPASKKLKVTKKDPAVKKTATVSKAVAEQQPVEKKKKGNNENNVDHKNASSNSSLNGEDDIAKRYKIAPKTDLLKHRNNIKEILLCSNATPIRRYGGIGYTCCYCEEQYHKPQQLKTHTLDTHKDVTKANFMTSMNMAEYVVKLDISSLSCKLCDTDIDSLEQLIAHLVNEHNRKIFNDIKCHIFPFKFDSDILRCPLCDATFDKFRIMANHMHIHYRNFVCSKCDVGFVNRNSLTQHADKHRTGVFSCTFCKKVFRTLNTKRLHERISHTHRETVNKCAYCIETFKDYRKKEIHLSEVHGIQTSTPKCQSCDKVFNSRKMLSIHIKRDHLMDRPHKCTYCDMRFFSSTSLKSHVVKHTKLKEFKCEVCSKTFARSKALSWHKQIHETEKRYKCEQCGEGFIRRCSWRLHMQKKHDDIV